MGAASEARRKIFEAEQALKEKQAAQARVQEDARKKAEALAAEIAEQEEAERKAREERALALERARAAQRNAGLPVSPPPVEAKKNENVEVKVETKNDDHTTTEPTP